MNSHRSCVKAKSSTFLYEHFNHPEHDFSKATIQIIDSVDPNISSDTKNDLCLIEDYWIDKLGTAFPLGLNDRKKGSGNISKNKNVDYFNGNIARYKRGHGKRISRVKTLKTKEDIEADINTFKNRLISADHTLFKTLRLYNAKEINILYSLSQNNSGLIYNVCSSYCSAFFSKYNQTDITLKTREYIIFPFTCKFMDKLNFKSIVSDTSVLKLLPQKLQQYTPLQVFYKYNDPISLRICNYGSFLKNLTMSKAKDILNNPCCCTSSQFLYTPLGHIITGNLEIVEDIRLRNVLSYGCKYRIPMNLPSLEIKESLLEALDDFIKIKSIKYKLRKTDFDSWKNRILEIITNRINFYEKNYPNLFTEKENLLDNESVKRCLNKLKNEYIICRIDKASNNFVFICKKFYIQTLIQELGFDEVTFDSIGNDTYKPCEENEEYYVDQISSTLLRRYGIKVEHENMCLPRIFWNPKLQKDPYKARFIAGAKHCATKPLNIMVNSSLKLLREYFGKYCEAIYNNSCINQFWSIESSIQFLNILRNNEVYNLQVYDFTTLYTMLDLKEVEDMINEVIDLIFSERNKYICISKFDSNNCFFSKKKYNNYYNFNKTDLKESVKFIIYNTYITFGGNVFIQTKGIPMGGNSSSPIADLTLGKMEFNYMKKLIQGKKFGLAKLLSNNCRYVDDLITINYLHFQNIIKDIYPHSLEMERSGNDNKNVNYLDLNITIDKNGVSINVYNKTDDFNFHVISLTYPHSNIPLEVGYNVFYSQILRFGNICTSLEDFTYHLKKIFKILSDRGYHQKRLINLIRKCLKKYNQTFRKFNIKDDKDIITNLQGL